MAELKTKKTTVPVSTLIASIANDAMRADAKRLLRIFKEATGMRPALWGTSIVGYGTYHYASKRSAQEGDWPLTGFAPRKTNLTIYIMPGFTRYGSLLKKLGTHSTSVSCLYIKRLGDIDETVLTALIARSVSDMMKRYPLSS